MDPRDYQLKIDEVKAMLKDCENILSELRDEKDSPKLDNTHRLVSQAVTEIM